jgi:hypothetical protein
MLAITLITLFILLVITIVVIEVINERRYQEERRKRREASKKPKTQTTQKPTLKKDNLPQSTPTQTKTVQSKPKKEKKKLPTCTYPQFTHSRLVEMGLSDEEAKEFVQELIPQLEEQIPLIEEALNTSDYHQMERLTHSIKGSTTNLGTGGVSDLLIEGNTYLKTGTDYDIAKVYFESLKHYTKELKEQYA